jgi:hypothetical protein
MQDLMNQIEASFKAQFPKGYCNISKRNGLAGEQINLTIGLVDDIDVVTCKIRENDPMIHKFLIFINGDNLEAVSVMGSLAVKPVDNFYAMNFVKTKFRKTTGNADKISKMYAKWFKTLRSIVNEQGDNIYKSEQYKDFI